MLPYLSAYMGHSDLRGTQYYLQLTADATQMSPRWSKPGSGTSCRTRLAAGRSRAVSRVSPVGGDLASHWLSKFLTEHLAGQRDVSPQTTRLTETRSNCCSPGSATCRPIPHPKSCASPTSTGPGCSRSWTRSKPNAVTGRRPQPALRRDQVVRPVHRDRAGGGPRPLRHPDPRRRTEEDPGHRHGLPRRRRGESPPRPARPGHPARAAGHRPALHPALRHRRPRPRSPVFEHRRRPRGPPDAPHAVPAKAPKPGASR